MELIYCTPAHAPEILAIFNEEILHSTSLYDYQPRTMAMMETWFAAKQKQNAPVIGAIDHDGSLAGFVSYGSFRPWPAYKYSVEHSVYVHKAKRGQGLGKRLISEVLKAARQQEYHTVIGGIDSQNTASIKLHLALGFTPCGRIKQAGFKFGRWLDLEFYQFLLDTPQRPVDG
jgi:phosphinothricin acetyltransferase